MAGSRKPGPLGLNSEAEDLNDGTLIRALSPRPGPICAQRDSSASLHAKTSVTSVATQTSGKPAAKVQLQLLRQGRRGPEVKKLQRLLNVRLTPSPQLAVDGIFGPLTHQGVLQYQRGLVITADGVVGKKTWYHLLKGDKVKVFPLPPPQLTPHPSSPELQGLAQPPNWTPLPTQKVDVWEWSMQDKFVEVLRRTAPKVPGSMRKEFEALLSPTSLAFMGGALVLWAGSHAFAVGEIVDVVLLAGGLFFLGLAVFDVARELGDFLVVTSTAADEKDLEEGASHLARAIAIMGVAAFIALLAKVAKSKGGGKGAAAEAPPKPPPEGTSRTRPRNVEPPPEKAPEISEPAASPVKVPEHAQNTLRQIEETGRPPRGYKGGRTFENDGRGGGQLLPKTDPQGNPINYQEYDVHPYQQGVNRGPERIVRGSDGTAYYTSDHYGTFTKIK